MSPVRAGALKAGIPIVCRTEEEGMRRADKAVAGGSVLGARIVRVWHDAEADEFGEPEYLGAVGQVPAES